MVVEIKLQKKEGIQQIAGLSIDQLAREPNSEVLRSMAQIVRPSTIFL